MNHFRREARLLSLEKAHLTMLKAAVEAAMYIQNIAETSMKALRN